MRSFVLAASLLFCACQNQEWTPLIATENPHNDWVQYGGSASYEFEGNTIIGTCVPNAPNSFLATTKSYANFELQYEVLIDDNINSGVQIRSHTRPEYLNGIVHGYQIEIDPSPRSWSAGIYEEGKRGWLASLAENPAARKAFVPNQWNHFRVRAQGPNISTWINGVAAAQIKDTMEASGFIALQVHSIEDSTQIGKQVRWKNLEIKILE
ncbi:MAG: DUF1080 domain-containing protein [Bacteroidetes bacterium]|nr:DUF1080 domain-containing protein [Bacteroidota bacterium]MDA0937508.1 DUF1080 domain-containing protein [Bacteroidota bacterium]MDA1345093.1 DUF1080 domain-containing protein [Bacteroidota bacterium]